MEEEVSGKRGRGRGRRGRGRGRGGRGRGKRTAVVVSSDEDASLDQQSLEEETVGAGQLTAVINVESTEDQPMTDLSKDNESDVAVPVVNVEETSEQQRQATIVIPQTIDMEADISQLEAPTFTTISRGPPEPMLRLKWDNKVNLIGEKVLNPMIHCCDQCDKPILLYGRMIPCKHVFCLKCARAEPVKICPRCNDMVLRVEQSGLGTVFMCTHGGSRYGNTGCRRTYLSQRDLQAHINHRHVTQPPPLSMSNMPAAAGEIKAEVNLDVLKGVGPQRKLSESSATPTTPSSLLPQRQRGTGIGSIPPPGAVNTSCSTLTQANIARINSANEQQQHSSKVALHQTLKKTGITQSHHQPPETVADASYYSSVLNSFGSGAGGTGSGSNSNGGGGGGAGGGDANAVASSQSASAAQQSGWSQNQYYR